MHVDLGGTHYFKHELSAFICTKHGASVIQSSGSHS